MLQFFSNFFFRKLRVTKDENNGRVESWEWRRVEDVIFSLFRSVEA